MKVLTSLLILSVSALKPELFYTGEEKAYPINFNMLKFLFVNYFQVRLLISRVRH